MAQGQLKGLKPEGKEEEPTIILINKISLFLSKTRDLEHSVLVCFPALPLVFTRLYSSAHSSGQLALDTALLPQSHRLY